MKTTCPEFRQKSRWRAGAPYGNRNALRTGRYTREKRALAEKVVAWRRATRALLAAVAELDDRR